MLCAGAGDGLGVDVGDGLGVPRPAGPPPAGWEAASWEPERSAAATALPPGAWPPAVAK